MSLFSARAIRTASESFSRCGPPALASAGPWASAAPATPGDGPASASTETIAATATPRAGAPREDLEELEVLAAPGDPAQLVFSPDGSWLAVGSVNGQVQIWQRVGDAFAYQQTINREAVTSLAFNPANSLLAVGSSSYVYLIDLSTFKEYNRIPHSGTVTSVSFSPDGNTLLTSSLKLLQFWDMQKITGIEPKELVETACGRLTENIGEAQWSTLFGSEPFELLCPSLPVP